MAIMSNAIVGAAPVRADPAANDVAPDPIPDPTHSGRRPSGSGFAPRLPGYPRGSTSTALLNPARLGLVGQKLPTSAARLNPARLGLVGQKLPTSAAQSKLIRAGSGAFRPQAPGTRSRSRPVRAGAGRRRN